jgi:hypothetical protein
MNPSHHTFASINEISETITMARRSFMEIFKEKWRQRRAFYNLVEQYKQSRRHTTATLKDILPELQHLSAQNGEVLSKEEFNQIQHFEYQIHTSASVGLYFAEDETLYVLSCPIDKIIEEEEEIIEQELIEKEELEKMELEERESREASIASEDSTWTDVSEWSGYTSDEEEKNELPGMYPLDVGDNTVSWKFFISGAAYFASFAAILLQT